eukprot:3152378-Pleurochrysis_carterae.AAC.1
MKRSACREASHSPSIIQNSAWMRVGRTTFGDAGVSATAGCDECTCAASKPLAAACVARAGGASSRMDGLHCRAGGVKGGRGAQRVLVSSD